MYQLAVWLAAFGLLWAFKEVCVSLWHTLRFLLFTTHLATRRKR